MMHFSGSCLKVLSLLTIAAVLSAAHFPAFAQSTRSVRQDQDALIQDAAQSMLAGNLDQAESDLQTVLKTNPDEYRALNMLGMVEAQQQRNPEAEKIFKQVIRRKPDFASAYVNLGLLYLQTSRLDDAVLQFQQALRLAPGRADAVGPLLNAWAVQARAAAGAGELEQALSILLQARKLSPKNPDVLYDFGMVALRMSLFRDAAEAFQGVLAVRPDDARSLYGLGRAQMSLHKYQDAAETFSRYVQHYPQDASGHYALGVTLAALEKPSEATAEFRRSIEIQPAQTESYFQLGRICLDQDDLQCAADNFDRVLERDPHHAGALGGKGRIEFQRKNYAAAAERLQQSISADAAVREPHYYLGLTYARMGRAVESQAELHKATEIERAEVEGNRGVLKLLDSRESSADATQKP
jgi:tetratricopeptide (TPR) repeat protein